MILATNKFIYCPRHRLLFWQGEPVRSPGVTLVALIAQLGVATGRCKGFILTNN